MTGNTENGCDTQRSDLEQLRSQLEADRRAFEAARSEWHSHRDHRDAELAEHERDLHRRRCELEELTRPHDQEQAHNRDQEEQTNQDSVERSSEASECSNHSDYDPMAALENLRQMVESGEDEQPDEQPQLEQLSDVPTTSSPEAGATEDQPTVGNDSIEGYMNQLLTRVNGHSDQTTTDPVLEAQPAPTAIGLEPPGDASAANDSSTETTTTSVAEETPPLSKKPRSAPPDLTANLATMRELANSSARTAVDKSTRKKRARTLFRGSAASTTLFLLISWLLFGLPDALMIAGLMGACIGAAALLWHLRDTRVLKSITGPLMTRFDSLKSAACKARTTGEPAASNEAESGKADETANEA